ncbi:hypothetical protein J1N35_008177 [Gossypium stocksii]|uniref:Peptidase M3A/M3B catalytic domain-containing protein n=1 Tax=Gossypium stocksii TaxID=47602 RepID=A0A9D3W7Q4_9ROSI|nr:hypothetical protein J1N35_008177 [Gossypium stocksii]
MYYRCENVLDATKKFEKLITNKKEIDGLLTTALRLAAQTTMSKGHENATAENGPWMITLDALSFISVMQLARHCALCEKAYRAYITRALSGNLDNTLIINQILKLWLKKAKLLNYNNYAEKQSKEMEKALTKVGSFWISKKAKEELFNITEELSAVSNTVEEKAKWILNKLKGRGALIPLADVLREHNLPPGLFPRNITCYEMDDSKSKLSVYMPAACEVRFKDGSAVRYGRRVKGTLSKGKLSGMEGMKTKVVVWVKVTGVSVESCKSDKVWFMASGVKKSRPKDAYELPHDSVRVEEI